MHSSPISYRSLSKWKKLPDLTFDEGVWANLDDRWLPLNFAWREPGGHPMLFLSRGKMKNVQKILSFVKTAG
jgi:hypothetical protein